jgi:hypothetical protein
VVTAIYGSTLVVTPATAAATQGGSLDV